MFKKNNKGNESQTLVVSFFLSIMHSIIHDARDENFYNIRSVYPINQFLLSVFLFAAVTLGFSSERKKLNSLDFKVDLILLVSVISIIITFNFLYEEIHYL